MEDKNLNKLVLDVGSGNLKGHIARGNVCIDIVKNPFHKPEVFVNADAYNLPFGNNVFDKALIFHVIEHLHNPMKALQEIHRVLKPNCRVHVSVPNPYHWRRVLMIARNRNPHDDTEDHIQAYCPWEISNLLRIAGFKNIIVDFENFAEFSFHKTLDSIFDKFLSKGLGKRHLFASGVKK